VDSDKPRERDLMTDRGRPRGRPRRAQVDESILRATADLIAERGLQATTIQAVAERSKVARATIYLRWPSREALIAAALRAAGREPFPLSGDIETDLRHGADQAMAIFSAPLMKRVLPALVSVLLDDEQAAELTFDAIFPNRVLFADAFRRQAGDQGFRADVDGDVVVGLLVGSVLLQLLATGRAPTTDYASQVVDVVLAGIRDPLA
jgi:AcrR family transcriptional regulator